jgi:hypothetical protein
MIHHYNKNSKGSQLPKNYDELVKNGMKRNNFANCHMSAKNLEPVYERPSEQRTTIKNVKPSEYSSNESTPRIEEEEIIVNTLQGGYSEAIKKSFHDKNLN